MQLRTSRACLAVCASGLSALFTQPLAAEAIPDPTIIGPVPQNVTPGDPSHDYTFLIPADDLAAHGFVQEEFFQEGTANSYNTTTEPPGQTGTVVSGGHHYKTRVVVRRPASPERFNGTVLLEWQNVSAGYDIDAHWGVGWPHFVEQGYAWVGVSAQRVGVHGASAAPGAPPDAPPPVNNGLIAWSPLRYGSLDVTDAGNVTDDSLCYDIFSQTAQALRSPTDVKLLGDLAVERIVAMGASQSAGRLSIYHNAIHPLHEAVDAFYLLVGGQGLRTDLTVKVFQYLSETDVRGGPTRRMEDTDHFRSWEVAGSAHSSYYSDVYRAPLVQRDFGTDPWPADCDLPPYSRVRGYHVINAQYDLLVRWLTIGEAPPIAPKIEFIEGTETPTIARDERGNALGGIRLPELEAPTAIQTGINSGATFCNLYGTYQPFDAVTLNELYPERSSYSRAVAQSALQNLRAGYLQRDAAWEFIWNSLWADVPPEVVDEPVDPVEVPAPEPAPTP